MKTKFLCHADKSICLKACKRKWLLTARPVPLHSQLEMHLMQARKELARSHLWHFKAVLSFWQEKLFDETSKLFDVHCSLLFIITTVTYKQKRAENISLLLVRYLAWSPRSKDQMLRAGGFVFCQKRVVKNALFGCCRRCWSSSKEVLKTTRKIPKARLTFWRGLKVWVLGESEDCIYLVVFGQKFVYPWPLHTYMGLDQTVATKEHYWNLRVLKLF